jgi:hypothetical protein
LSPALRMAVRCQVVPGMGRCTARYLAELRECGCPAYLAPAPMRKCYLRHACPMPTGATVAGRHLVSG